MPSGTFGGFAPFPRRFGGGPRRLEILTAALNYARGKAYDASTWSSTVSVEDRAIARAVNVGWETNDRAACQFDPNRMGEMLPRWERIFQAPPLSSDSPVQRRARIAFKWAAFTKSPVYQQIYDDLTTLMGSVFVGLVHTPSASGQAVYPGNNSASSVSGFTGLSGGTGYGSPPTWTAIGGGGAGAYGTTTLSGSSVNALAITYAGFGYTTPPAIVFSSGNASVTATIASASWGAPLTNTTGTNPNPYDLAGTTTSTSWVDWSSAVALVGVKVQQPAGMPYAVYQAAINAGSTYLDGALPSWCQFSMQVTSVFILDQANFGTAALSG